LSQLLKLLAQRASLNSISVFILEFPIIYLGAAGFVFPGH